MTAYPGSPDEDPNTSLRHLLISLDKTREDLMLYHAEGLDTAVLTAIETCATAIASLSRELSVPSLAPQQQTTHGQDFYAQMEAVPTLQEIDAIDLPITSHEDTEETLPDEPPLPFLNSDCEDIAEPNTCTPKQLRDEVAEQISAINNEDLVALGQKEINMELSESERRTRLANNIVVHDNVAAYIITQARVSNSKGETARTTQQLYSLNTQRSSQARQAILDRVTAYIEDQKNDMPKRSCFVEVKQVEGLTEHNGIFQAMTIHLVFLDEEQFPIANDVILQEKKS